MANTPDLLFFIDFITHTPFTRNNVIYYFVNLIIET